MYAIFKDVFSTKTLVFQSKFTTYTSESSRQSVFIFGMDNGIPVHGLLCIGGGGNITYNGTGNVSGSMDSTGKVTLTLDKTAYDRFLLISSEYITD